MSLPTEPEGRTRETRSLRFRIKECVQPLLSSALLGNVKSISTRGRPHLTVYHDARASQLSLTSELPLPPSVSEHFSDIPENSFQPPSYLEVSLVPLRRPASPDLASTEGSEFERDTSVDIEPSDTIYTHSQGGSSEELHSFHSSHESLLPPFPGTVTEIVDLIRMAASLLYKEMQLILISETQTGIFPALRSNTWARLGLLHHLINSWPSEDLSALEGIRSFGKSLSDGTILCEFVNRLSPATAIPLSHSPDLSAQITNILNFISVYESFGLPASREVLAQGNLILSDLGPEALASYARAIISIHERFGEMTAPFMRRTSPRPRSSRDSIASLTTRIRRSTSSDSSRSRRYSSRFYSQSFESPSPIPESILEDTILGQIAGGGEIENDCSPQQQSSSNVPIIQLPLDAMRQYKCLLHIMEDEAKYQEMLSTRGADAQELLDFFQKILDYPQIVNTSRSKVLTALIRLSTASGLYPQCFTLKPKDLEIEKSPVTCGHFGEILKGTIQGQPVCVKVIKLYQKSQIYNVLKVFLKEAVIWGQLQHPNLLPFYGVYHLDDANGRICLVSPWMENGTVVEYLRSHPNINRLLLVHDIAQGLNFLHNEKIVHGDLKGANILVTKGGRACLADFGLSSLNNMEVIRFAMLESSGHRGGTPRWEAPELLDESDKVIHRTPESDIYAFGCVCYEVFTGKVPFFQLPKDFMVYLKVSNGERPTKPASGTWPVRRWGLIDGIWELMTQCWSHSPADRPTARAVLDSKHLRGIKDLRPPEQSVLKSRVFRSTLRGPAYEGPQIMTKAVVDKLK